MKKLLLIPFFFILAGAALKITNNEISSSAAIAFSKLAALNSGNILVGSGSNVVTSVTPSGDVTSDYTGSFIIKNASVIGKVLAGYSSGAGTVASTDTILQAINKLNGNDALAQPKSTLTTKGDLYCATGSSAVTRLPVSADGTVLTAQSGATCGVQWAAASGGGGATNSFVKATTGLGDAGSTYTKNRRFGNQSTSGTDLTITDSVTDGLYVTVNTTGMYAVQYSDVSPTANTIGITINESSGTFTSDVDAVTYAQGLRAVTRYAANDVAGVYPVLYLTAGDIIRFRIKNAAAVAVGDDRIMMRVTKIN